MFWFHIQIYLKCFSSDEELSETAPQMYTGLHVKYPLFILDFNQTWIFLTDYQKIIKHQISSISVQWSPGCSMHTDSHRGRWTARQTCTTKHFALLQICLKITMIRKYWNRMFIVQSVCDKKNYVLTRYTNTLAIIPCWKVYSFHRANITQESLGKPDTNTNQNVMIPWDRQHCKKKIMIHDSSSHSTAGICSSL